MRVAVVGASGFVGKAVVKRLGELYVDTVPLRAPRIVSEWSDEFASKSRLLSNSLIDVDVVVNCAGVADAVGSDDRLLMQGNAYSAEVVAMACSLAGVRRLIHVSSAAVQGRLPVLDSSERTQPFSRYSLSKAEGEARVRRQFVNAVIYRPPGVHSVGRKVTRSLVRFGSSPFACVAGSGRYPSPQSLIGNVADAIVFLAISELAPPPIVSHPWEGVTTGGLLRALGNKKPLAIPFWLARSVVFLAFSVGRFSPSVAGYARRAEVLWLGQAQAPSWLTFAGWAPPFGLPAWDSLGAAVRRDLG